MKIKNLKTAIEYFNALVAKAERVAHCSNFGDYLVFIYNEEHYCVRFYARSKSLVVYLPNSIWVEDSLTQKEVIELEERFMKIAHESVEKINEALFSESNGID